MKPGNDFGRAGLLRLAAFASRGGGQRPLAVH